MARRARTLATSLAALAVAVGCNGPEGEPSLSKSAAAGIPDVPVPAADGPKLGALSHVAPVFERPAHDAKRIGYLHAGSLVARAEDPYSKASCEGGWYPVRPQGFVCAGESATTDLAHPTLVAMSLRPKLDQPLPYAYARVRNETPLYDRDAKRDNGVVPVSKLGRRAGLAVVGSWSALDPDGARHRLGLLTNGQFLRAADLESASPSEFFGVETDGKEVDLPVAFVLRRGVHAFDVDGRDAKKGGELAYHSKLLLTGRFRTLGKTRYWALGDGRWVRHPDVVTVRRRNVFPDFATGTQKWLDVSVVTGTLVAYEGKKPVYATLVSVGRDRLGDPKTTASTAQGTFEVVAKHITGASIEPSRVAESPEARDVPWVLELSSGQMLHGAFWHDRFGIEHGPGNLQLSPRDAQRLWSWATPELPDGWHGVLQPNGDKTLVLVRK
jgi:hypothetical protein